MSCGDWDIVNCEPREREKQAKKEPPRYADEDSAIVVQRDRKEKGAYTLHTVSHPK